MIFEHSVTFLPETFLVTYRSFDLTSYTVSSRAGTMLSRVMLMTAILYYPGTSQAFGQQEPPAVTLAEAIRRSERVQPAMVQAAADVRTSAAQRRSALGAYLPRVTASSSGSGRPGRHRGS